MFDSDLVGACISHVTNGDAIPRAKGVPGMTTGCHLPFPLALLLPAVPWPCRCLLLLPPGAMKPCMGNEHAKDMMGYHRSVQTATGSLFGVHPEPAQ
jgi:hypothetical protein